MYIQFQKSLEVEDQNVMYTLPYTHQNKRDKQLKKLLTHNTNLKSTDINKIFLTLRS